MSSCALRKLLGFARRRPTRGRGIRVLDNWLPFLIYAVLRGCDPRVDDRRSRFVFAHAAAHPRTQRLLPFESGVSTGAPSSTALHGQLLPDGDALHPLRHRDRVPLSARGHPPRSSAGSASSSSSSSSRSSSSPTSTSGGRERSNGNRRRQDASRDYGLQLRARALADEGPGRVRAGGRRHRAARSG